jgi:hypothetical protein
MDGGEDNSSHQGSSLVIHQTTEQLIARCIAPVKKDFIRPPPDRTTSSQNDTVSIPNDKPPVLAKEKKSKRQLKRERRQVGTTRISILHIHSIYSKIQHNEFHSLLFRTKNQQKIFVQKFQSQVMLIRVDIKISVDSAMI